MTREKIFILGYGHSGGTLVGDFFYEFSDISYLYRTEFDLIRGAGGLDEIGKLIQNSSLYTKDSLVHRYLKLIRFLNKDINYKNFYGPEFERLSYDFISNFINYKCESPIRQFSINENIKFPEFFNRKILRKIFGKKYKTKFEKKLCDLNFNNDIYYVKNVSWNEYISIAKQYLADIFDLLPENKKIILHHPIDILGSRIDNQLEFFDNNYKVFIVDKDPRDIFVAMINTELPYLEYNKTVEGFIKNFKENRKYHQHNMNVLKDKAMYIRCEDVIFNYDEWTKKIMNFANFKEENHIHKMKYFNPEISKQYVGAYKNYKDQNAIKKIENELSDYIKE